MCEMAPQQSDKLMQWASDIAISFSNQQTSTNCKSLSQNDFGSLCKGPMLDVWCHLIKHVHPSKKVKQVKGNLALNAMKQCTNAQNKQQMEELQSQKCLVSSEVNNKSIVLHNLNVAIEQLHNDIVQSETECENGRRHIKECKQSICMLNTYYKMVNDKVDKYASWKTSLDKLAATFLNHIKATKQTVYVSQSNAQSVEHCQLEKLSSKRVRDVCKSLEKMIEMLISGSADNGILRKMRNEVCKSIEEISSEQSPSETLEALQLQMKQMAENISKSICDIDHLQQADHFTLANKADIMNNSPERLISALQFKHVNAFLDYNKAKIEVDAMTVNVEQQLSADQLMHVKNEGLKAAIHHLTNHIDALKLELKQSVHIETDEQCIANLHAQMVNKQKLIQTTIHGSLQFEDLLHKSVQEIATIREEIGNESYEISGLENWVCKDVKLTSAANLSWHIANMKDASACPPLCQGQLQLQQIISSLHFPFHKDLNRFVEHVFDLQNKFVQLNIANRQNVSCHGHEKQTNSVTLHQIHELVGVIKEKDEKMIDTLCPVLKTANSTLETCLAEHCPSTEKAIKDWWTQPAQHALKYMKVEGKNFHEWLNMWNFAVVMLNKI